jgi:PhnB protein
MKRATDLTPFVPDGWRTVTPRIVARDAARLVEFVRHVFGATGTYRDAVPSELTIGDSIIMISEAGARRPMTAFLYVYVGDTDRTYRRALQAGARSLEEPSDMFYGDRRCMLEDRWGNTWQVATHTRAPRSRQRGRARKARPKSKKRTTGG